MKIMRSADARENDLSFQTADPFVILVNSRITALK